MIAPAKLLRRTYWIAALPVLEWTTPVALLAILAAEGYLFARNRTSPPAKAGASILLPLALGLTIVAAAVGVLNVAVDWSPTNTSVAQLKGVEDFVHRMASRLPSYLKLQFPIQVLVLCGLYLLALGRATWKPVSGFVDANKWAGRVLASAVVVNSFSLFGHGAGWLQDDADRRIRAVYTESQRRQGEELNRYLSAKALVKTMRDPGARTYLTSLVNEIAARSLEDGPATHLGAYVAKKLIVGETAADVSPRGVDSTASPAERIKAGLALPSDPWSSPERPIRELDAAIVVPTDATAFIEEQKAREDETAARARDEERKAIKTILDGAIDASTKRVNDTTESFVRSLIEWQGDFFADQTAAYLTKVLDKSFDALIEPLVERIAGRLQVRIRQVLVPNGSVERAARATMEDGLTDLTVRVPAQYLRMAGEQARDYLKYGYLTIQHNMMEVMRARLYSSKARALLTDFGPASPDGTIDMRPVSELLQRVMPEVRQVLENEASRRRFERDIAALRREVEAGARRGGRRVR
ncbi:MAG: hypothetical protein AB7N65_30975 [Vicinamibacterales bacterium]